MKHKMIAAVIIIALIPTMLLGLAVYYNVQIKMQAEKLKVLTDMAHIMDSHLSGHYSFLIGDVQRKADQSTLRHIIEPMEGTAGERPVDRDHIFSILMESNGFSLIGGAVIDQCGNILISTQSDEEGLMMNQTELYQSIMNGDSSYVCLASNGIDSDMLEIAVPIHDSNGNVGGILKQSVDMDFLSAYLQSLDLGKSSYSFLIFDNGSMFFDNSGDHQIVLYHEYQNTSSLEQLVTDFKDGRLKEASGTAGFESKGIEYISAYEKVGPLNCIAVVAADRNEMLGDISRMTKLFIGIALAIFVVITVCGYLIGYWYLTPLNAISNTLGKIANGDLSARYSLKENSEFGELGRNINNLADSYQKSEKKLRMSSRIDNLTHLPNRIAIYEALDTLLYKHPNQALILVSLDGIQDVNDNLGFDIGDRILMEVGDILRELPQHVCYSSRLGGTKFLVFLTNWKAPRYPETIADKIINKVAGIRFIDEIHVDIGTCIGIEYTGDEKIDKNKLIKHSNIAMHKARSAGRNSYFVYYPYLPKES